MKLAALFSGGKDSTYAIYKAQKQGHQVECLLSVFPLSDESTLLHFPNIELTKIQSNSMRIPQIFIQSTSNDTNFETNALETILKKAKEDYSVEGMVHGGLQSKFQKQKFEKICSDLDIKLVSPLWQTEQVQYMKELINSDFNFIITSVTADGLDDTWLGKQITITELEKLEQLSKKYGFNINFEGGEAETFVIDCPLYSYPIKIEKTKNVWDGYRGRFEILEAKLDYNAR